MNIINNYLLGNCGHEKADSTWHVRRFSNWYTSKIKNLTPTEIRTINAAIKIFTLLATFPFAVSVGAFIGCYDISSKIISGVTNKLSKPKPPVITNTRMVKVALITAAVAIAIVGIYMYTNANVAIKNPDLSSNGSEILKEVSSAALERLRPNLPIFQQVSKAASFINPFAKNSSDTCPVQTSRYTNTSSFFQKFSYPNNSTDLSVFESPTNGSKIWQVISNAGSSKLKASYVTNSVNFISKSFFYSAELTFRALGAGLNSTYKVSSFVVKSSWETLKSGNEKICRISRFVKEYGFRTPIFLGAILYYAKSANLRLF